MRGIIAGSRTALALCGPAFAGPLIDGNVADWGITIGDGNSSNFSSPAVAGTVPGKSFFFAREDRDPLAADRHVYDIWAPSDGDHVLDLDDRLPAQVPEPPGTRGALATGVFARPSVRRRR
jgi:hypothetical protein